MPSGLYRTSSSTSANRQILPSQAAGFGFADVVSLHRASTADRQTAVAIRCGGETLTFADLERKSNHIARMLAANGVTREVPVGLWIERSPAFVVALLGVLKAGGAYVPLDPKWPVERIRGILKDGGIEIVLAAGEKLAEALTLDCRVLDADTEATSEELSTALPEGTIHPAQTAYVIYTSGSTGTPKGVAVSHGALANYVQALLQRVQPSPTASMAMVSTVAADLGHTVLFGALASGATLHLLPPETVFDADSFAHAMRDGEVGILKIVPSHLRGLLQASRSADILPRDVLILGGEACDTALLDEIRQLRPQCRIVNHYGPTETTVGAVTHECEPVRESGPAPIGLPLANLRAHVLDDALNEVPIGVAGELYIGGAGLARGYRGRPGLTAERFVPIHLGRPESGSTGPGIGFAAIRRGGWCSSAARDDQIKLRGYRVELGEVARAVKALQEIDDAVVIARAIGPAADRQELVAYCVSAPGTTSKADAIKQQLAAVVPEYMVPSQIVLLERLPLTPNGKVDRKALPAPDQDAGSEHPAPEGETEEAIAAVWREVLGREQIGRNDNFFELGGDSILSLQIIARFASRHSPDAETGLRTANRGAPGNRGDHRGRAAARKEKSNAEIRGTGIWHTSPAADTGPVLRRRGRGAQSLEPGGAAGPEVRLDWEILRARDSGDRGSSRCVALRFEAEGRRVARGAWRRAGGGGTVVGPKRGDAAQVTALASAAQASLSLSWSAAACGRHGSRRRQPAAADRDPSSRYRRRVVAGAAGRHVGGLWSVGAGRDTVALPPKSQSYASWGARLHAYATAAGTCR